MGDTGTVGAEAAARAAYRGRLAPSPTGYLHLGHARTFWVAGERARTRGGTLVLRNEDLDPVRSRPEFAAAMLEDLRWLGIEWQGGAGGGRPFSAFTPRPPPGGFPWGGG